MACGAAGAAAAVAAAAESASLEALLREALSVRGIPTRATKVVDLQAVRGRGYQPGRFQLLIAGHRQVANEPCSASARSTVRHHEREKKQGLCTWAAVLSTALLSALDIEPLAFLPSLHPCFLLILFIVRRK